MMMVMQGAPRSLQHWDSALEESGYSPRISTRVTPRAANDDSPAKDRTAPFMALPLPSNAAASDAHTLGQTLPASDAHTSGQKVTVLPPIPEAEEEGLAAAPPGSVHLLGEEAVPKLPSTVTCDSHPDQMTHVPNWAAAASGDAAMPEVQSVEPAAQHPADSASKSDSGSQQAADSASGTSAAAMHPAGHTAPGHSSSPLLELVPETAKVEVPEVPLLPRCPNLDGFTVMAVSSALHPPSSPTLDPSKTPVESGTMPLDGAAACTASDSSISQTDKGSSLAEKLVSAGGDSAESGSANADSEAAAGVSNMQSAAAEESAESILAGPAANSPTLAALVQELPTRAATASETAPAEGAPINGAAGSQPAQGMPTPPVAESLPAEGIPNADAASSPSAQGIPAPEASGAVPTEGIPSRIAARNEVMYPVFGVAWEQNGRAYMEDRADVLQLQLPHGEEAHMLAVKPSHTSLHRYQCVQHYL